MSSHSGTIGRKRGGSGSASTSSEYYFGSGGQKMRRQRSAEWHSRHGYSSSEDEYQNVQSQTTAFDTHLLAQLLLQSQQLANMDRYGSDAENGEICSSLLQEFPTATNRDLNATQSYQQQQQLQNTGLCSPIKTVHSNNNTANNKYQVNNANNPTTVVHKLANSTSTSSAAMRSTNPFLNLNTKYDSQSNSDSLSERLSYSGSAVMLDRLQAAAIVAGDYGATTTTSSTPKSPQPQNATFLMTGNNLTTTTGNNSISEATTSGLNSGPQQTLATPPSLSGTTHRAHRSKSGRTLSSRPSGMTSSSSGTSSNGNAANSAASTAAAVAVAMANRSEREKLKLQQIQMELREFAQSASESSAIAGVGAGGAFSQSVGLGIVNNASDLDDFTAFGDSESEPPPEPAPPEIPPRAQSLLMSLRKQSDYKLKYEDKGDQKHEEFIPTSQLQQHHQKDYLIAENSRTNENQAKSINTSDSPSQQG